MRDSWQRSWCRFPPGGGARVVRVLWVMGLVGCNTTPQHSMAPPSLEQLAIMAQAHPETDLHLGRRVYLRQCSICHQANGAGAAKAIPPLRGHLPHLAA